MKKSGVEAFRSLKKILADDMDRIVLVVCPNTYFLHRPANNVFVRQMYWGFGYWEDCPSYERVCEISKIASYSQAMEVIMSSCQQCANYATAQGKLLES